MNTACKDFRKSLERMAKHRDHWYLGEIIQVFDQLHQSHKENTGDKCEVKTSDSTEPVIKAINHLRSLSNKTTFVRSYTKAVADLDHGFCPCCLFEVKSKMILDELKQETETGRSVVVPGAAQCEGVPIRVQFYVPFGYSPSEVVDAINEALVSWLGIQKAAMEERAFRHHPLIKKIKQILLLNIRSSLNSMYRRNSSET